MTAELLPYRITLNHPILRGATAQSESVCAVDAREAIYEFLEHHPEIGSWRTLDLQVRCTQGLTHVAA